jgi:hypothetical protein
MSEDIELPWVCLTCGYAEVPGEDFNNHDCDEFRALPKEQKAANRDANRAEVARMLKARPLTM